MVDVNKIDSYVVYQKQAKGNPRSLILKVQDDIVVEIDANYRKIFDSLGVSIPPSKQAAFNGKKVVYLNDSKFPQAFREIYYHLHLSKNEYELTEV